MYALRSMCSPLFSGLPAKISRYSSGPMVPSIKVRHTRTSLSLAASTSSTFGRSCSAAPSCCTAAAVACWYTRLSSSAARKMRGKSRVTPSSILLSEKSHGYALPHITTSRFRRNSNPALISRPPLLQPGQTWACRPRQSSPCPPPACPLFSGQTRYSRGYWHHRCRRP